MYSNKSVFSSFVEPRKSSISFRQYLIPKDTIDDYQNNKYKRLPHHLLDSDVLAVIGDASIPEPSRTVLQKVTAFYKRFGIIIRPDSRFLPIWLGLLTVIIIYYIIEVGLLLGFGNSFWSDEYSTLLGLQIFFVVVLTVDILISPLKAFYSEGLLVKNVGLIIAQYTAFEVYLDLLGVIAIALPLIIKDVESNWIKVLWFLKLYSMSRINEEFQRMTQLYIVRNTAFLVIKLVIYSVFYAHFMGILFYLVSLALYNRNYYGPNTPNILWITNS
jgi:hypothetical protein